MHDKRVTKRVIVILENHQEIAITLALKSENPASKEKDQPFRQRLVSALYRKLGESIINQLMPGVDVLRLGQAAQKLTTVRFLVQVLAKTFDRQTTAKPLSFLLLHAE